MAAANAATLDELAEDLRRDDFHVEVTSISSERDLLGVYVASDEMDGSWAISTEDRGTLPPWAVIEAVSVRGADSLREVGVDVDADHVICVTIADSRGLEGLIDRGLSAAEALDYYMVERRGWTQSSWADRRGIGQGSVSENVSKAREKLAE